MAANMQGLPLTAKDRFHVRTKIQNDQICPCYRREQ